MKILILDDEKLALEDLVSHVREVVCDADIVAVTSDMEAIEKAKEEKFDVAFLDIEMPGGMNGLEVAKNLKEIQKDINIIFVTAYVQYALDAYKLHVSGYILKPASFRVIEEELRNLRRPVEYNTQKLEIHCFGNFEVYINHEIVSFARSKTKELFAYLIDRNGTSVTLEEACHILWDGDDKASNKVYFRKLMSDLRNTLKKIGMEEVLVHSRNAYSINKKYVECDYYKFLSGDASAVNMYFGEYMKQYSWAEMRVEQ